MREARPGQQVALESEFRGRALAFVTTYSMFFETWMPALRARVPPFTEGAIGFAYIAYPPSYVDYGFYPQGLVNPRPVTAIAPPKGSHRDSFEALIQLNCVGLRGGGVNFVNSDPRRAAIALAWESVKQLIQAGGLDERQAPCLSIESVLAIAGHNETRQKLRLPPASYRIPHRQKLFPLDLEELRIGVQEHLGLKRMEIDWLNEQVRTRSRFTQLDVSGDCSIDISGFDRAEAREEVHRAIAQGVDFSSEWFIFDRELVHLIHLIEGMKEKGINRIEDDLLPSPDLAAVPHNAKLTDAYSETTIQPLIESFLLQGFEAYFQLVACNFGRIASQLSTFARQPLRAEVAYIHPRVAKGRRGWSMTWGYGLDAGSARVSVRVDLDPREPYFQDGSGGTDIQRPTASSWILSSDAHLKACSFRIVNVDSALRIPIARPQHGMHRFVSSPMRRSNKTSTQYR